MRTRLSVVGGAVLLLGIVFYFRTSSAGKLSPASRSGSIATIPAPKESGSPAPPPVRSDFGNVDRSVVAGIDVAEILKRCQTRYSTFAAGIRRGGMTRFQQEGLLGLTTARLLCLIAPGEVASIAMNACLNPAGKPLEWRFGIALLTYLMEEGIGEGEGNLVSLASGDGDLAMLALGALSRNDVSGKYRSLYLKKCQGGEFGAIDFLTWRPDKEASRWIRSLQREGSEDWKLEAKFAEKRLDILEAPDSAQRLYKLLAAVDGDVERWTPWAMTAAQSTSLPGLRDALRERLDWAMAKARERHQRFADYQKSLQAPAGPSFDDSYVEAAAGGSAFPDPFHDETLLLYVKAGGRLSDLEMRRCNAFGYFCDPQSKLVELLAKKP